jgi:hypothetical protein
MTRELTFVFQTPTLCGRMLRSCAAIAAAPLEGGTGKDG